MTALTITFIIIGIIGIVAILTGWIWGIINYLSPAQMLKIWDTMDKIKAFFKK
jgi:hypothetical protein